LSLDHLLISKYPSVYVVNYKNLHWFSLYCLSPRKCFFFDSLGRKPSYYNLNNKLFKVDSKYKLQCNNSSVCGQYSIYYLYMKVRKCKFIMSRFKKNNCKVNDCIVAQFVKNI
jgi:hypothetical protein